MHSRSCKHCQSAFQPNTGNQIYCSATCRTEATWPSVKRPRPLQVCVECETNFRPDSGNQKRCRACIASNSLPPGRRPDPNWREATCPACDRDFQKGAPQQRYCSQECKRVSRRQPRACVRCGAEFNPVANQQYCTACKPSKYDRVKVRREYMAHKKESCERCDFQAEHSCQLDVHHRDGDFRNNEPSNLETLCANCHRLESQKESRATPPPAPEVVADPLPTQADLDRLTLRLKGQGMTTPVATREAKRRLGL